MISLALCIQETLGLPWAFKIGGPTDRVGDSFFVHSLSKLCVSDMHLCVREKHVSWELTKIILALKVGQWF